MFKPRELAQSAVSCMTSQVRTQALPVNVTSDVGLVLYQNATSLEFCTACSMLLLEKCYIQVLQKDLMAHIDKQNKAYIFPRKINKGQKDL